jgi:hypothetical protein
VLITYPTENTSRRVVELNTFEGALGTIVNKLFGLRSRILGALFNYVAIEKFLLSLAERLLFVFSKEATY